MRSRTARHYLSMLCQCKMSKETWMCKGHDKAMSALHQGSQDQKVPQHEEMHRHTTDVHGIQKEEKLERSARCSTQGMP